MPSKILYDTRDNSILRCQPEPKGSATLPSFETLCKSARVSESQKENLDTIIINGDYLTKEAQEKLRVMNNQVALKPKVVIELNKTKITAIGYIILNIKIHNTFKYDNYTEIKMQINDVEFAVPVENNQGVKEIELQEPNIYKISCIDRRFISQPIEVEVV